eukprot:1507764-Pleurochrysis_carterae.AAC.1
MQLCRRILLKASAACCPRKDGPKDIVSTQQTLFKLIKRSSPRSPRQQKSIRFAAKTEVSGHFGETSFYLALEVLIDEIAQSAELLLSSADLWNCGHEERANMLPMRETISTAAKDGRNR